ncbi:hypothetical protein [Mesorhizobium sp.]|uniref:hypothetical protein n=1 Tax=Mesorhizobium sp. TaxID=1871066 RepID=UPI000FE8942F|nr:hypothetical protein [Mesorhizobium sp.]RWG08289.1 MAG: hypothetical protein EOQ54_01005 [Mesorhizobium sp.]TIN39500.1 MAG: hypothetical protein E5Y25_20450 [Mesorhizobium sp.]TIR89031.1 MAG: hypothetical protein E5X08_29275 [Mesorhizobium sp.]TIS02076.1 MAG: hypothetical protein E5X13_11795 [Mesorhizobium sp.]
MAIKIEHRGTDTFGVSWENGRNRISISVPVPKGKPGHDYTPDERKVLARKYAMMMAQEFSDEVLKEEAAGI